MPLAIERLEADGIFLAYDGLSLYLILGMHPRLPRSSHPHRGKPSCGRPGSDHVCDANARAAVA
jgi:hypothetical protein